MLHKFYRASDTFCIYNPHSLYSDTRYASYSTLPLLWAESASLLINLCTSYSRGSRYVNFGVEREVAKVTLVYVATQIAPYVQPLDVTRHVDVNSSLFVCMCVCERDFSSPSHLFFLAKRTVEFWLERALLISH